MAPKQKRPSMLTRQRQLIKQRNQVKSQSSKQLPPRGGTGAGSPKAAAQRTATRVGQKVRQDVATLRALADNMKRNQAREARQIKPDPSPRTRYVGPKGANPKGQASLPPGQRGGEMQQRGGPLARSNRGAVTANGGQEPVQQVRVRDLGKNSTNTASNQSGMRGTSPSRSLPAAGQSGGSQPPKGTTVPRPGGPARTVEQVAQERRAAAASRAAGQNVRPSTSSARPASTGTPVGEATRAATRGSNFIRGARNFAGRAAGPALAAAGAAGTYADASKRGETPGRAAGQALAVAAGAAGGAKAGAMLPGGPFVKGVGALVGGAVGATAALKGAQGIQEAGKAADRRRQPTTYASAPTPQRQGPTVPQRILAAGGGRSNPPTATSKAPAAPKLPPASQTTRSSTPARQSAPPARRQEAPKPSTAQQSAAKASESSQVSGIGPVKDGQSYANQKLSIKETVRELQAMRKRSQERQKQNK